VADYIAAYVVYFLIVLPFHYIHPRRLKWFFDVKWILCLPAMFGMLIWACQLPGDALSTTLYKQGNTIGGSAYSWVFLSGLNVSVKLNFWSAHESDADSIQSMLGNYGSKYICLPTLSVGPFLTSLSSYGC
jgi:cytosine/uracil/thiamine/allantoin permease